MRTINSLIIFAVVLGCDSRAQEAAVYMGNGLKVGEVTAAIGPGGRLHSSS